MENNFDFMTFSLDENFDIYDQLSANDPIRNGNKTSETAKKEKPQNIPLRSPSVYNPIIEMVSNENTLSPMSESKHSTDTRIPSLTNTCIQSELDEASKIIDGLVADMKSSVHLVKDEPDDPELSNLLDEFLDWEDTLGHGRVTAVSEFPKEMIYSPISTVDSPMTVEKSDFSTGNMDSMVTTPKSQYNGEPPERDLLSPPAIIPKRRGRPQKGDLARSPRGSEPPSPVGEIADPTSGNGRLTANSMSPSSNFNNKDQSSYFSMANYINQPDKSVGSTHSEFSPVPSPNRPMPVPSPVNNGNVRSQYGPGSSPNPSHPALSPMGQMQSINATNGYNMPSRSPHQILPSLSPMGHMQQVPNKQSVQNISINSSHQQLPALSPISQQPYGNAHSNVVQHNSRMPMVQMQTAANSTAQNYNQQTMNAVYQPALINQRNMISQNGHTFNANGIRQSTTANTVNVRAMAPGQQYVRLPSVNTLNRPQYVHMVNQSRMPNTMANRVQPNMAMQNHTQQLSGMHYVAQPRHNMQAQPNLIRNGLAPQQASNVRVSITNQPHPHLQNFNHQQNLNYRNTHPQQQQIYNQTQQQQMVRQTTPNQLQQYPDQTMAAGQSPFVRSPLVSPQYMQTCNPHMVQPQMYPTGAQPTPQQQQPNVPEKATKPKRGRKRKVKEAEEIVQQQLPTINSNNMQQMCDHAALVAQKSGVGTMQNNGYPMYQQQSSVTYYNNSYPDQMQSWNGVQTHTSG